MPEPISIIAGEIAKEVVTETVVKEPVREATLSAVINSNSVEPLQALNQESIKESLSSTQEMAQLAKNNQEVAQLANRVAELEKQKQAGSESSGKLSEEIRELKDQIKLSEEIRELKDEVKKLNEKRMTDKGTIYATLGITLLNTINDLRKKKENK